MESLRTISNRGEHTTHTVQGLTNLQNGLRNGGEPPKSFQEICSEVHYSGRAVRQIFFMKEGPDSLNPNVFLHAQYYNGYAETLLNYNKKEHALRFGIAFVR